LWLGRLSAVDSPSHLVRCGKVQEAHEVLQRLYGIRDTDSSVGASKAKRNLILQIKDLEAAVEMAKRIPKIRVIQAICDPFFRMAVCLGVGLAAFQQLCGINGLMSYSNSLFADAGIPPSQLTLASTMMAAANVVASVCSSRVVDNWGRRRLLSSGSLVQTLAMLMLTLSLDPRYNSVLPAGSTGPIAVACLTVFVMSFSFGLGAVTWLYLSEIYPMEIRTAALSTCGVVNWLSSFVVVFGTRFLSLRQACTVFGIVCLVGSIGAYIWVVETKGCSMEDSPLTPRSGRSTSVLLTPTSNSPRTHYKALEDEEEGTSDEEVADHHRENDNNRELVRAALRA